MQWRTMSPFETDEGIEQRWRALASRSRTPNPCMEPEFIRAAAQNLPEVQGLRLFMVEEHGELIGLLPAYPSARRGSVPVVPGIRTSWDRVLLGQPLMAPGHETSVAEALLAYLSVSRHAYWLRLQTLDADGLFARSLIEGARGAHLALQANAWSRGLAVRRPEPTYLTGQPHANLKRLHRQRQAFERSVGQPIEVVDRSADAGAVEEFMMLEAAGWKGRDGVSFLARPGHADFLRDVCNGFRVDGRFRLWGLQSGDRTLAMKLDLAAGDSLFCYLIAFDEDYARVSPGLQLEVENFRLFHAEPGFRIMDSCASSDNSFANRLYPDRRALIDVNIGSGAVGRTLIWLVPVVRRAATAGKSLRQTGKRGKRRGRQFSDHGRLDPRPSADRDAAATQGRRASIVPSTSSARSGSRPEFKASRLHRRQVP